MNASQFYALMICRRAMGDLGTDVELTEEHFAELVESAANRTPVNPAEARRQGWVRLNSCNGPTLIYSSGRRPNDIEPRDAVIDGRDTRCVSHDHLNAQLKKSDDAIQLLEGELKHVKTMDEAGRRNAHDRITDCEKRHAALVCFLKERGVLWACDKL